MTIKPSILLLIIGVRLIFPIPLLAYEIGHTSIIFTDPARNRPIPVEIYYPADTWGENVPVAAPDDAGFPTISFGHGYLMPWDVYANIWTTLVPAGYIIGLPRTGGEIFPNHLDFGLDLAFVIQALQAEGENPASAFYEKIGPTSAVMGHSMGGGASILAAAANPNITALTNLAAAETNPSAIDMAAGVTIPTLLLAGSDDCVTPVSQHQMPIYNALASNCKTLITLTGGSHCQFAEYNLTCSLGELTCPTPGIDRATQHELVNLFLLTWLAAKLTDNNAAWIDFENWLGDTQGITFNHTCQMVSIEPERTQPEVSLSFSHRNYPNPFNRQTTIEYSLLHTGRVELNIYNLPGQRVWRQDLGLQAAGKHHLHWSGVDRNGQRLSSGSYIYQLRWNDDVRSGVLILQK